VPSLTSGRVRPLQLLLALTSAVIFGYESRRTRDHILLSWIRDFLCVTSYDSQGHGEGIQPPPPHVSSPSESDCCGFVDLGRPLWLSSDCVQNT
jgi:hypothetical protein